VSAFKIANATLPGVTRNRVLECTSPGGGVACNFRTRLGEPHDQEGTWSGITGPERVESVGLVYLANDNVWL